MQIDVEVLRESIRRRRYGTGSRGSVCRRDTRCGGSAGGDRIWAGCYIEEGREVGSGEIWERCEVVMSGVG